MTLKQLSSVYYIHREIEMLNEKIILLETQAEKTTPSLNGMPGAGGVSDRIGCAAAEIADYLTKLEEMKKQCIQEKLNLLKYINEIPDSQIRLIFIYRFIDLMSWIDVAEQIGGNNTADSVKKKAYRYIQ